MLFLTNKRLYFQPYHSIYKKPVINYKLKDVRELFKRRYKLMNIGLEFLLDPSLKKTGLYLTFSTVFERDTFYDAMLSIVEKNEGGIVTAE